MTTFMRQLRALAEAFSLTILVSVLAAKVTINSKYDGCKGHQHVNGLFSKKFGFSLLVDCQETRPGPIIHFPNRYHSLAVEMHVGR